MHSSIERVDKKYELERNFVRIPGKNYSVMKTEVTQKLYESITGKNPSWFRRDNEDLSRYKLEELNKTTSNYPVEEVSWHDTIEFCNALSEYLGYEPVYTRDGGSVTWNENANGFRLPTVEEWQYAARGGENYLYSGSDNLDEVGWYAHNSGRIIHPVAQKKPNGYGLYDMSGNVWEWCWDSYRYYRSYCGGCWDYISSLCEVGSERSGDANGTSNYIGFRIVRSTE